MWVCFCIIMHPITHLHSSAHSAFFVSLLERKMAGKGGRRNLGTWKMAYAAFPAAAWPTTRLGSKQHEAGSGLYLPLQSPPGDSARRLLGTTEKAQAGIQSSTHPTWLEKGLQEAEAVSSNEVSTSYPCLGTVKVGAGGGRGSSSLKY